MDHLHTIRKIVEPDTGTYFVGSDYDLTMV